jgi:hypothetical protein
MVAELGTLPLQRQGSIRFPPLMTRYFVQTDIGAPNFKYRSSWQVRMMIWCRFAANDKASTVSPNLALSE